jgi:isopentenyl-diphosphate Delta-isomerase
MSAAEERVVLLDEAGNATGTMLKADVHHSRTPLHLAFSCYVFDRADRLDQRGPRLLVTRRALHKPTWPGVWTNSFCGHPGPGEDLAAGVRRRAEQELGLALDSVQLVLPAFRYEAEMADGVRENELCPVFVATAAGPARPDPAEVDDHTWEDWAGFREAVLAGHRDVSPWCVEQVAALAAVEERPGRFTPGSPAHLPPGAGRPPVG